MDVGTCVQRHVRTDSHVTTKNFEINGLPKFLMYGSLLGAQDLC